MLSYQWADPSRCPHAPQRASRTRLCGWGVWRAASESRMSSNSSPGEPPMALAEPSRLRPPHTVPWHPPGRAPPARRTAQYRGRPEAGGGAGRRAAAEGQAAVTSPSRRPRWPPTRNASAPTSAPARPQVRQRGAGGAHAAAPWVALYRPVWVRDLCARGPGQDGDQRAGRRGVGGHQQRPGAQGGGVHQPPRRRRARRRGQGYVVVSAPRPALPSRGRQLLLSLSPCFAIAVVLLAL